MSIAIIGANGGTGRQIVTQALERGQEVHAYVRRLDSLQPQPRLQIVAGTLEDASALQSALRGVDTVLCCLGPKVGLKQIFGKQTLMREGVPRITTAMKEAGVKRLVLLSAYGVGDWKCTVDSPLMRFLVKTVCATAFEDKEASEQELCDSGLDWTCVYPVFLNDATLSGKVDVQSYARVEKVRGLPKVSRADVAKVMLDAAADPKTIAQRLLITSPGSVTLAV